MDRIDLSAPRLRTMSLKRDRLRAHLATELKSGRLLPGQALPTEVDIARDLQVSRNTVRHALAELERMGLVRRVQGKGTFVTEKASKQSSPRTASFALVVLDVLTGYYRDLFAAFERCSHAVGCPVAICNSNNDVDRQGNHILSLLDQQVAGVVLNPCSTSVTPPFHVRMLQAAGIPVVLLHRGVPNASAPVLEIPGFEVGRRAGRMLVDQGHRRVAFLDSHRTAISEQYLAGMQEVLAEVKAEIPEDLIYFGSMMGTGEPEIHRHEAELEEVFHRLMARDTPPTALFLGWAEMAEKIYLQALRLGLRVPDDLSIVCFGGAHQKGAILSRLTTVTLDETAAAERAVQLLMDMREGRRPIGDSETLPLPLGFGAGETLGPPARR